MSKKVLVISSSPRKGGNSDLLCDEFARGASDAGHSVEKIFLGDKNINYCSGCGYCTNNKGICSQKDDMVEIKDKMIEADTIVLATPIYFYAMAGQMKTFIDRNCFFYTLLKNKEFYIIMTAADTNADSMNRAIEEFRGYFDCLNSPKEKGYIYGTGVWKKGEVIKNHVLKEAYQKGKNI